MPKLPLFSKDIVTNVTNWKAMEGIIVRENRFGFEPEKTAKIAKK
jgi:hypothetical protein